MTDLCGRDDQFFRLRSVGDKYFHDVVEVVNQPSFFFLVEVKATTLGSTAEEGRLRVQVTQDDIERMVA